MSLLRFKLEVPMSSTLSISPHPLVWDEKTVLESGMTFLTQKNEELKLFQDLWDATKGNDFYNSNSKLASEQVKKIAENSRNEVISLNKKVVQLLISESSKDPLSEQTQQLQKVALASQYGINYFTSVVNDTYYPTLLNWSILETARASNKLAFCATVLTGAAYLGKEIIDYTLPSYATIPIKASLAACIGFNAIRYLNLSYRYNSSIFKINNVKIFFELALHSENGKASIVSPPVSSISPSTQKEHIIELERGDTSVAVNEN
jgi:hypothetical protein